MLRESVALVLMLACTRTNTSMRMPPGMKLGVSLCQIRPVPGDADANAETMARMLGSDGSDALVFPECFLEGYGAEPNGAATERCIGMLRETCRDSDSALAFGAALRRGGRTYNSLVFLSPDEGGCAVYDKTHLARFGIYSEDGFAAGGGPAIGTFRGIGFGLSVCYDIYFPEVLRACALRGASVNICASAAAVPSEPFFEKILPARALENVSYLAFVNNCGRTAGLEMAGGSRAMDPLGAEIVRCGRGEEVQRFVFDSDALAEARCTRRHLDDFRADIGWYGMRTADL